jgi:hypothetical protein
VLDGPVIRQTLRRSRYDQALQQLRGHDLLVQQDDGGWSLSLDLIDAHLRGYGTEPADLVTGSLINLKYVPINYPNREVPLTRHDGSPLWHLATVVDDLDLGVNLIVRGTDKINAVAVQERLRCALSGGAARTAYVFI